MWITCKIRYSVGLKLQSMFPRLLVVFMQLCAFFCCICGQLQPTHAAVRSIDRVAHTIYYNNRAPSVRGDFYYEFQTSNGITTKAAANEFGHSGVVQYISPEGIPITLTYIADVNGYHPKGDHIPKLPEHVLVDFTE